MLVALAPRYQQNKYGIKDILHDMQSINAFFTNFEDPLYEMKQIISFIIGKEFIHDEWEKRFRGIMNHGSIKHYQIIWDLLDETSQNILLNYIRYIIYPNSYFLKKAYELSNWKGEEAYQYFDPNIIHLNDQEVFVDCGAYIGETTKAFLDLTNEKYKSIYCFEPIPRSFKMLSEIANSKITCYQAGVGSVNGYLNLKGFPYGLTTATFEHTEKITTFKQLQIDDNILEKITMVKMDIEGMELETIKGMKEHIKHYHPKLAIAAYHCTHDPVFIIDQLRRYTDNYDYHIRHYDPKCYWNLCVFAIPKGE